MTTVGEEEDEYKTETTEESAFRKTTEISDYSLSKNSDYYKDQAAKEDPELTQQIKDEIQKTSSMPFEEFKAYMSL